MSAETVVLLDYYVSGHGHIVDTALSHSQALIPIPDLTS